jgi:hypothetical protein
MKTTSLFRLWLPAALLLAGCSRQEPEEAAPTEANASEVAPLPEAAPPAPLPAPSPTASPTPANPEAEPIAADEQMMDDAAATGMTARSERGGEDATDQGSSAVEEVEAK